MTTITRLALCAAAALAATQAGVLAGPGNGGGKPAGARGTLSVPEGAADGDATGRIDVKYFPARGHREERSWYRIKVRHLDASTAYTLWGDDPSTPETDLVQFDSFTTDGAGKFNYTQDSKHGGTLPFSAGGATVATLGGTAVEVRNADGTVTVLAGTVPATAAP